MTPLEQRLLFPTFRAGWLAGRRDWGIPDQVPPFEDEQRCSDAFTQLVNDIGEGEELEALYGVAKRMMHQLGLPWTDPRTGVTYPPPHDPA